MLQIDSNVLADVLVAYYTERIPQNKIVRQFNLPVDHTIFKYFGSYDHNLSCRHCDGEMKSRFVNRSASRSYRFSHKIKSAIIRSEEGYLITSPECNSCGHTDTEECKCTNCAEEIEQKKKELIEEYKFLTQQRSKPKSIEELNPSQALFSLFFLIKKQNSVTGLTTNHSRFRRPFYSELSLEINTSLKNDEILCVSPSSIADCINVNLKGEHTFDDSKLDYQLNINHNGNLAEELQAHCKSLFHQSSSKSHVIELWGKLALHEAILYFCNFCQKYTLPIEITSTFKSVLLSGLNQYGLAGTAYAIRASFRYISPRAKEQQYNPKHTINTIKNNLSNYWFNESREKKYGVGAIGRDEEEFPEPGLVTVFRENFLPITTDYISTPLKHI